MKISKCVVAGLCLGMLLALGACKTSHKVEMHIVLDIRHIEGAVEGSGDSATRSLATGEMEENGLELTPAMRSAMLSRRARTEMINRYRGQGYLGENNLGYLGIPFPSQDVLEGEERARVEDIILQENTDREILYMEMARIKRDSLEDPQNIRKIWSEQIRRSLMPGEWFEVPEQEHFLASFQQGPLGAMLPEAQPGAWVQVPANYMPAE